MTVDRLTELEETIRHLHARYEQALLAGHEGERETIEREIDDATLEQARQMRLASLHTEHLRSVWRGDPDAQVRAAELDRLERQT